MIDAAVMRLEGRISRFRENQEAQAAVERADTQNFQKEIWEAVVEFKQSKNVDELGGRKIGFSKGAATIGSIGSWRCPYLMASTWMLGLSKTCFEFYRLVEEEKIEATVVAMEGDALRWFRWENQRKLMKGWIDLKKRALHEFRPREHA